MKYVVILLISIWFGCKKSPETRVAPTTFYKLTLVANGAGSLATNNTNAVNETTTMSVAQGEDVVFLINPNVGNGVLTLTVDGVSVPITSSGGTTYTLTNVQANHTISVTFEPMETITITTDGFGTALFSQYQVLSSQSVTLTFLPKQGFATDSLYINGTFVKVLAGSSTYNLDNIVKNEAIKITFALTHRALDSLTNLLASSWHYVQYDYQYTGTTKWITAPYITDCEKPRHEVYTTDHKYTYFLGGAACDPSYAPNNIYFDGTWKFDPKAQTILIAGNEYSNATTYQYVMGAFAIGKLTPDSLVISYPQSANLTYRFHYVHK